MIRRWIGVGLVAGVLSGCASSMPEWAQSDRSPSADITAPAMPRLTRSQVSDGPVAPPPKQTIDPMAVKPITINAPPPTTTPPTDPNTQQVSLANRGTVRISVCAWVNGRPIFDEEVLQLAAGELPEAQRTGKVAEVKEKALEHIIEQELMYQDAVKKLEKVSPHSLVKLRDFVDSEFDRSLQKMRNANFPEDQIRKLEPIVRRMMERNLVSNEYARSRIDPFVKSRVGLKEIKDYYDTHLNEFRSVDRVEWQDVFIKISPSLPTIEDAKRFAEELVNKCRTREDFNQLLVYDDSKLGGQGFGNRRGEIRPVEIEEALFKTAEGQIGPVVPISTGVHVFRVTKREYDGQLPLDDTVQKTIRRKLEGQVFEREYRRLVRELKERSVLRLETQ